MGYVWYTACRGAVLVGIRQLPTISAAWYFKTVYAVPRVLRVCHKSQKCGRNTCSQICHADFLRIAGDGNASAA